MDGTKSLTQVERFVYFRRECLWGKRCAGLHPSSCQTAYFSWHTNNVSNGRQLIAQLVSAKWSTLRQTDEARVNFSRLNQQA